MEHTETPPTAFWCCGCSATFSSSRAAADHSRATYHMITMTPRAPELHRRLIALDFNAGEEE